MPGNRLFDSVLLDPFKFGCAKSQFNSQLQFHKLHRFRQIVMGSVAQGLDGMIEARVSTITFSYLVS
jgi:hypothetical protein